MENQTEKKMDNELDTDFSGPDDIKPHGIRTSSHEY